jgi:hypothetical protein
MTNTLQSPALRELSPHADQRNRTHQYRSTAYATYFDSRFLTRGLALLGSLARHHPEALRWVLCIDELVYQTLKVLDLPNTSLLRLEELERTDAALQEVKPERSRMDYFYTLTAPFLRWVYEHTQSRLLVYVDADVFFFDDPSPVLAELGDGTLGIIDHRYPAPHSGQYVYGVFNVGVVLFQRSQSAYKCLEWWRERCIEWCFDRLEGGRYGEQKYLEQWPSRFSGVTVLQYPGSGLATWNVQSHCFERRDTRTLVNGKPLVNFHFSKFRVVNRWLYDTGTRWYGYAPDPVVKRYVYTPYAEALEQARLEVAGLRDQLGILPDPSQPGRLQLSLELLRCFFASMRRGGLLVLGPLPRQHKSDASAVSRNLSSPTATR